MRAVRANGFTLAEVLVASTISGFIAVVAVGALKTITDGAQVVNRASETTGELRFAVRMLARDLANLYRDPDAKSMKLLGASQDADTSGPAFLTFYTVGRAKARAQQPEGDIYEVEYLVVTREAGQTRASPETPPGMVLMRRVWPNPDKDREPRGVLTPIMDNLGVFQVRFFDGKQWGGQWTQEMTSLPEMIEVTLGTLTPGRAEPVMESFLVNFPRLAKGRETSTPEGETSEGPEETQGQSEPQESTGQPAGEPRGPGSDDAPPDPDRQPRGDRRR